jgi:hypothetical protein
MTAEGIYYFTATTTNQDGDTYTDTIAITVLNRAQIDTLLKSKWEGMKIALTAGNVEGAVGYFASYSQERYRQVYAALGSELQTIAQNMQQIQLIYVRERIAKYRIRRDEAVNGQTMTMTYYIYFVKDEKGFWRIDKF